MSLTLVIGNKNYSSWSLRPWMLLRHLGLAFAVEKVQLDAPRFKAQVAAFGPAGRVPMLRDGELVIWDSLAICEYLNERAGGAGWPADAAARALARSVSAEMHSGFAAMRSLSASAPATPVSRPGLRYSTFASSKAGSLP